MSQILAKIAFYDIINCGYLNVKEKTRAFCSKFEMLQGLHQWTKGKNIWQTITFSPEEDSQQSNIYCYDMQCGHDNSAVLITWNGYNVADDNIISAINGSKPVGNDDIKTSEFSEEYIPGFPTYFWFPNYKYDVFATVRFEQRYNGRNDMCSYIKAFLTYQHPSYVFSGDEDGSVCYGRDETDPADYIPTFQVRLARLPGKIQYIKDSRTRITKLRQQGELRTKINAGDKAIWQKLTEKLGASSPAVREHPINYDVSIDWAPSKKELEGIINKWTLDSEDVGRIGVVFKGDSANTHWFDTCLAKTEIPIDVERNSSGFISATSLLNALNKNKENIFAKSYAK